MIAKNLKTAMFLAFAMAVVAGCGSTTNVYDANKMLILHGDMHNVSKYTTYSSSIEGTLPNGEVIDLDRTSKKQFKSYLEQHSEIHVTTKFLMDDQEVIYEATVPKREDNSISCQTTYSIDEIPLDDLFID